ncbi:MAG: class I SAM-dependent methyltransferase [Candidatus Omnitrophota bacterium]
MVYVNPRFKESIAHGLYDESDYTEYFKIKLIPAIDYRRDVLARNKYRQIGEYFSRPGKVLDIGCGLGEVLSVFKENGWDCTGIEFNRFAAKYAEDKFELNIINKSIFDIDESSENNYDLIMLWGVLEHFYDPKEVLRKVNKLLAPGGLLLLEVPSADSVLVRFVESTSKPVDRIIEGDRHIMLFSLKALEQMTGDCGFSLDRIISNGLDIATINRLYLGGTLDKDNENKLQALLDGSCQGDLLRGFFRKKEVKR